MSESCPQQAEPNARGQLLLASAREAAHKRDGYSSSNYRYRINQVFRRYIKPDSNLFAWQKDVAEALHLGLDCVAIAGTGSGKTIPFFLDRLMDRTPEQKKSKTIIISPLIELQLDMVRAFVIFAANPN